jgi:hypothetical protein
MADSLPVGLQTAEDRKYVVLAICAQELFAVSHYVGMAGRALLIRALGHAVFHRWRLRRQLRKRNGSYGQH